MKVRVASAGTGKTTSLVLRYLELIAGGVPLRRIAGVTFTRAAASELRQRVDEGIRQAKAGSYLGYSFDAASRRQFAEAEREISGATLTTIHGFMREALKLSAPMLSLDPDFKIMSEGDALVIFEEEFETLRYLAAEPQHPLHEAFTRLGDDAGVLLLQLFASRSLAAHFTVAGDAQEQALVTLFERLYSSYRTRLAGKLLAPAELERYALQLTSHPEALARLASRFQVLLVDEFQDVNPLQGHFFRALEKSGISTEVVGDPKQAIYNFRHADVEVFRQALQEGEALPPLLQTRRHATMISRFLNKVTSSFAARAWGFNPQEAQDVETVGAQADVQGRVELHWIVGSEAVGQLRVYEAEVLAARLQAAVEDGFDPDDMAVLARSHASLALIEQALWAAGLPAVRLQGRDYYQRLEIRDLYHAMHVGLEPSGLHLAAWLRSPFAALKTTEIDAIMAQEKPLERLRTDFPDVYARLEHLGALVREPPVNALQHLMREPFIAGRRYVDFLGARERENLDALLFEVASFPPREVGVLLEILEQRSQQAEVGDVPQRGSGIKLLTMHASKGLEWKVVALYDLGRMAYRRTAPLIVTPQTGEIALTGSDHYDALTSAAFAREDAEGYRLFYVAASRARDRLILTGSIKNDKADGWAKALTEIGLGTDAKPMRYGNYVHQVWPYEPPQASRIAESLPLKLEPAPYTHTFFPAPTFPALASPSRYQKDAEAAAEAEKNEPLAIFDPEEGERIPGRGRTIGTLVHYAISQNWISLGADELANLRAQEVMFPFSEAERDDIMQDVELLLNNYAGMLGDSLPRLAGREVDRPELPFVAEHMGITWQGIIDRLYKAAGVWYLEDYKTDRDVKPEVYALQLALYNQTIQQVLNVTPQVQLVYLRAREVVRLEPNVLQEALDAAF